MKNYLRRSQSPLKDESKDNATKKDRKACIYCNRNFLPEMLKIHVKKCRRLDSISPLKEIKK